MILSRGHHKTRRFLLAALTLILVAGSKLIAQQNYLEEIGAPPADTTIPVELGAIDLTNGNLHLEIPLGSFPQRGSLTYTAKLVYDSRIWVGAFWGPTFLLSYRPVNVSDPKGIYGNGGWRMVVNVDSSASKAGYSITNTSCNTDLGLSSSQENTNFGWVSPDGTLHTWQGLITEEMFVSPGAAPCDGSFDQSGAAGYADDGSGYYMDINNYTDITVYAPDGSQVFPSFKDKDGNYFSNDSAGNVIDTLGRTPVLTTTSGNIVYYDILNEQGSRSRYTVNTEAVNVSVPNYSGTLEVIQSVGLPNGTSYVFGYDAGSSGDNWGGITSVKLPTGAQIDYGYTTFADATSQVSSNAVNRWVNSRTSDTGHWSYTPAVITASSQTQTVTKRSGDFEVYSFQETCSQFLLKEVDAYGAGGALMLKKVIDRAPIGNCLIPRDPTTPTGGVPAPIRVTTTEYGSAAALTDKSEYDYTNAPSINNPTKISEWNFYTGTAPATPDRVRQVTYSLTNPTLAAAHIIGKPLSVTLSDGAGTQIAQTSYTYDNYAGNPLVSTGACQTTTASQPAPAAPHHDYQHYCTSNTVRGNLTQFSKWLNTTGALITTATNTYDDTGNIVTSKDALSNPTTFEYSSTFGHAYVTKITNAKNQVTTKNYDFPTGLQISETDPNGQVTGNQTKYTYDNMGRLTETDYPDGGQTKVNFNGDAIPLKVTTTHLAIPDPSIVSYTNFDGLGRVKNECLTDPEGDDCVDTGYDVNGRVQAKSNPRRTTAAASDGSSTFAYDGLDRPKSVTEPDNNSGSSSYDVQASPVAGETTTTNDETGRQRRTVTDAFGRLLETDEPGDAFAGAQAYGAVPVNGPLRSTTVGGQAAAPGTGSLTITGTEASTVIDPCASQSGCISPTIGGGGGSSCPKTIYDKGNVTITVNGHSDSAPYGLGSTDATVASGLASAINSDASAFVTASASPGSTVLYLTAKQTGPGGDYSWNLKSTSSDTTGNFGPNGSFSASPASGTMGGGSNGIPGTTVWDAGTVSVSVGSFTGEPVPYGSTTGIDVRFTNDSCSACSGTAGGGDRNLFINSITVGATTILPGDPSVSYVGAPCNATSNGIGVLACNGDLDFTTTATGQSITISAYGSPDLGIYPTMQLLLNGTLVAQWTVTDTSQNYTVNVPAGDTTASLLATALAATLNVPNSPVTATATSTGINITYKSVGFAGNAAVTVASTPTNASLFPGGSFSGSTTLANGADAYPSGLAHPYVTRYFYDLLDNLTCVEQHGNTTGSGCNPAVMPVTASGPPSTDAASPWRIRRFAYDSLSRLRWSNDPESGLTTLSYDNNGNLTSETDARGVTINYSPAGSPIDALNRVTMITYSDGTPTMTYGYDQGCCGVDPQNGIGRLTYASGGNTELVFVYDSMGRITKQADCPPSGIARGFCYSILARYDLAGQMTSLTYPDGRTVADDYSAAGRMTGVTLQSFGGPAVNVPYYTVPQSTLPTDWGYWPSGAMNRGTFGNGIVETTGYNPRQQMNAISDAKGTATLLNRSYGLYDSASHDNGNVLSIADALNSGKSQSYGYDSLNRIISGAQADGTFNGTYSYDPWGNMKESGTSNFSPVYDVHNRIQPAPAGCTSSTPFCYDPDGNLLNDGVHAYSYDGAGRMKTVDSTDASYTYNPAGHRVRKDTPAGSTEYFYFGDNVISELNPVTSSYTDYIYGYGKRIAKDTSTDATGAQYFHTDQIGSTTLVTDSAGNIFWQAVYNAFGQELSAQNTTITFQFAGMQYDSEDNLNHTDFRQYASVEGRWLTPDPYTGSEDPSNPQSFNRYVYVLNNPIRLADSEGLSIECHPDDPICLNPDALIEDALGVADGKGHTQPCSVVFVDCNAKKLHTKNVETVTVSGRGVEVAYIEALPGGGNIHFANEQPVRLRIQCAINAAQGGSIAGAIGQSDNPYVSALLGNQAADAAQTALNVHDVFTAPDAGSAVRSAWDTAANWFAGKQVSATTAAALSTYSYKNKAVTKALLGGPAKGWSSATNLLKVGAKIVGEAKLAGDALVFGIAYGYSCAAYGN